MLHDLWQNNVLNKTGSACQAQQTIFKIKEHLVRMPIFQMVNLIFSRQIFCFDAANNELRALR